MLPYNVTSSGLIEVYTMSEKKMPLCFWL